MELPSEAQAEQSGEKIYTVTELNQSLRSCILHNFQRQIWICGEVEDFRTPKANGSLYFLLKDGTSSLRMVWWNGASRLPRDFQNGVAVEIYGKVDVYPGRGECQISVTSLRMKGDGAEMLKLKELKRKLAAEGLFENERKLRIPPFPKVIGLISAEGAAAVGDFMRGLGNRQSGLTILFFDATMQGKGAPESIVRRLEYINLYNLCQVIVIARGGGSKEDLMAFNDEFLARAVAASQIPVISAVGHQQDFTICDEVADLRAMTPTDAAKCVVQESARLRERIEYCSARLLQTESYRISKSRQRLTAAAGNRFLSSPMDTLVMWRKARLQQLTQYITAAPQRLGSRLALGVQTATGKLAGIIPSIMPSRKAMADELSNKLAHSTATLLRTYRERLTRANDKLKLLGPQSVLDRGYAIVFSENGSLLNSASKTEPGDFIRIRLADGELTAGVKTIQKRQKTQSE